MKRRLRIHKPLAPFCRDRIETFCSPPARGSGFTATRSQQPFVFEPIKCRVKSSRRGFSMCTGLDLRPNGNPVCSIFETQYGKKNNLLKLAEIKGFIHAFTTINYIIE